MAQELCKAILKDFFGALIILDADKILTIVENVLLMDMQAYWICEKRIIGSLVLSWNLALPLKRYYVSKYVCQCVYQYVCQKFSTDIKDVVCL